MSLKYLSIPIIAISITACSPTKNEQLADSTTVENKTAMTENDWLCIPGERAGIVTGNVSEQELIEKLGENVSPHDTIFGSEGFFSIGTILYKGTPNEAHITWKDTLNFKNPDAIEFGWVEPGNEMQVQWHTNKGIKIGTALIDLEKINEKPFKFYGFGWDYGGTISNWNGGKLMETDSTSNFFGVLGYDFDNPALTKTTDKLLGDSEFISTNADAQKLNPYLTKFGIRFK